MSNCIGPNCTHESHNHAEKIAGIVSSHLSTLPAGEREHRMDLLRNRAKKLTKNQIKAKRKKGIQGY